MPNMDKTGPNGNGPLTGRGMGNCENTNRRNARCRMKQGRCLRNTFRNLDL